MKKLFVTLTAIAALTLSATAQTNLQVQYDFDRECITSTLEMFKSDGGGNTFFFVDYNYGVTKTLGTTSPSETYFEIARCLNFWHNCFLKDFSVHMEYNGGLGKGYGINHAFLAGFDYFFHDSDYKNTLNAKILYKHIVDGSSLAPLQFTAVWGCQDIFGAKGLSFSGFADVWFEDKYFNDENNDPYKAQTTFISEPQLWYNVGRFIGVDNLNIGGEVELTCNFVDLGFKCRPCAGIKWVF